MKTSILRHIDIMNSLKNRNIIQKIDNVISLYEDKRIIQITTAENPIKGIATNNQKQRTKGP